MTIIKTTGEYQISSVKKDNIPSRWLKCFDDPLLGLILVLPVGVFLFLTGRSMDVLEKCGVAIRLDKKKPSGDISLIEYEEYVFTDSPEKDAEKVNIIVNKFEKVALLQIKEKADFERAKREKDQECCDQYKRVMEKVLK